MPRQREIERKPASIGRNRKKNMPRQGEIERKNTYVQASQSGGKGGEVQPSPKNQNNV